jgi:hypothetical protein
MSGYAEDEFNETSTLRLSQVTLLIELMSPEREVDRRCGFVLSTTYCNAARSDSIS